MLCMRETEIETKNKRFLMGVERLQDLVVINAERGERERGE